MAVLVMRKTNPQAERPFRVPFVPLVPILGIVMCLILMFSLPAMNWLRLLVWLGIGFAISSKTVQEFVNNPTSSSSQTQAQQQPDQQQSPWGGQDQTDPYGQQQADPYGQQQVDPSQIDPYQLVP